DQRGPCPPASAPSTSHREQRLHPTIRERTHPVVRRTLEGLCIEQGTQKKALFQALQELRDNGKIEGRLFDWAQALRVLGNQGAHFSEESVRREDAADALSLAEALLNYIYVFTAKYEEFQNRRQASAN
ncbi:DUF4145 domain-containing protein, partial [Streptomyces mirabilis]|uniref:DUF4145 domain-containing protein n=1 Tax=Streptomyces mirabilis TaxID=68239 RepID=UPI0033AF9E39